MTRSASGRSVGWGTNSSRVGLDFFEDLAQPVVDVARAVAERTPGRFDELGELLDGGLAEDRRRLADEVLPELPRLLVDLGRRPEPHEPLLEALRLERARERLLDDEDHSVTSVAQDLPDPDAVVRRAECPLGKENDGRHGGQHSLTPVASSQSGE